MRRHLLLLLPSFLLADWTQFRGPNASGVADATGLPIQFGPGKSVVWKTPLPPGHSSPVLNGDSIFLTASEGEKLFAFCLDRATGKIKWRREVPRNRQGLLHKENSPASASPVTDGRNVYMFFYDFGLISYGPDGNERWRMELGPFNNPFGMASSPVLAGDVLVLNLDGETDSYAIGVDKNTGRRLWRVERPDATRGFSTPVVYKPPSGPPQVLIAGSYNMTSYEVATGKPVWWVHGLTWQLKPTPVIDQDTLYIIGWAGGADEGQQEEVPPFDEILKRWDTDNNRSLSKQEITDERLTRDWRQMDLDDDGVVKERDWQMYQARRRVINAVLAFRLGGKGDMSEKALRWKYTKSLPNVPSPLLYKGVLYLLKEGGIFTSLDAATGAVLKQARLTGAPGAYFSSPVAADDKIYTISVEGKVSVIKPGPQWEVLAVNDLGEDVKSTIAIAGNRIYLRTFENLYCFAKTE